MKRRAAPPISTNRRRRAAGQQILEVRVRRSTARRQRSKKVISILLAIALWLGVGACTYFGFVAITEKFFLANPEYNLRLVEVDGGGLFSDDEVLSLTGFRIGENIFSANLAGAEEAIRAFDQVETTRIERFWPDRISVTITPREPVAWLLAATERSLSKDNALLVDREGRIMRAHRVSSELWNLPVIYCEDPQDLVSGDPLQVADLKNALALLADHAARPNSPLVIRSLDIRKGYKIEVIDDRGANYRFSALNDPASQLDRLERLLVYSEETDRRIQSADLLPKRYTPVEFVLSISSPAGDDGTTPPTEPAQ